MTQNGGRESHWLLSLSTCIFDAAVFWSLPPLRTTDGALDSDAAAFTDQFDVSFSTCAITGSNRTAGPRRLHAYFVRTYVDGGCMLCFPHTCTRPLRAPHCAPRSFLNGLHRGLFNMFIKSSVASRHHASL